jgi:hypothetical protein
VAGYTSGGLSSSSAIVKCESIMFLQLKDMSWIHFVQDMGSLIT